MTLYHGSPVPGLTELRPFLSNHDRPYVYLTHSEALAVLYAHNPIPGGGWFTYRWAGDVLQYDEFFPDALRTIYQGQSGWVYTCCGEYPTLEKMPWVYLSERPVPVTGGRFIPDLYEELLRYEGEGQLVIHRYDTLSEKKKAANDRCILRSVRESHLPEQPGDPYLAFIRAHCPGLLEQL